MADSRTPDVSATEQERPSPDGSAEETAPFSHPDSVSTESRRWGDFQLLQLLGHGGFGEVYRAWDPVLEREVALKLLLPQGLNPDQEFASIVAEARAIARVRHPNIVSVYGVDRRDGRVGFWSDFVRGQTLTTLIATRGPMDEKAAAQVGFPLCDALSAVHDAGLLHRDIKASNAMRDENGRVLLMDFGLSHDLRRITNIAGTPGYMAPELRAGQPASVQSDIYAMGVLLRFLSTGNAAASEGSSNPDSTSPIKVDRVSSENLDKVIRKATHRDPKLRYASAAQMGQELSSLIDAISGVKAPPVHHPAKRAFKIWLAALAVVLLAAAAVLAPRFLSKARGGAPSASSPAYQDDLAADAALARYDIPGNTDKAIALYQKTLERSPAFALAEAGLARAYLRKFYDAPDETQWLDDANRASARAMEMRPNLPGVQMTSGLVHLEVKDAFDLAAQELQQANQLDNRSAEVHAALSDVYRLQNRAADSKNELQTAIDLDPGNWRWPYLLAALEIDAGDYNGAEENLKIALNKTPDNARILYNLGIVYRKENRLPEAQSALEKAISLDPAQANPIMALGQIFMQRDQFQKAIDSFRQATQLPNAAFDAWGNLASAYQASGTHSQQASDAYRKAVDLAQVKIKKTPDDSYLVSVLGKYYANLHDESQALPLLRKAVVLDQDDPDVLERVAEAYEALGHRRQALDFMTRALKLGYSVGYAKSDPALKSLRQDPSAPEAIREPRSVNK